MSKDDRSPRASRRFDAPTRADQARRVADVVRQQIHEGVFGSGRLPDEDVLATDFGVSRNAVREALRLLRVEGLITRRPGVGTTVVARRHEHGLDRLTGLAEALDQHGPITNEVRAADTVRAPASIARRLDLPVGATVVCIERLRHLGGRPLSLDLTYLPKDVGVPVLAEDLEHRDLFALIEATTNTPLGLAEVRVQATDADPHTAQVLGIASGRAVLTIERLTRLADGRPVDLEIIHLRADRITLSATVHRDGPGPPPASSPPRRPPARRPPGR